VIQTVDHRHQTLDLWERNVQRLYKDRGYPFTVYGLQLTVGKNAPSFI